jgi:PAS domain S-box-containing protein
MAQKPTYEMLLNRIQVLEKIELNRKLVEVDLWHQTQIHKILMSIAANCINVPLDKIDDAIQSAMAVIGEFVFADRVYVFNYDFKKNIAINTYEWCNEGVEPQIKNLQDSPLEYFPEWVTSHLKREPFIVPDVTDLPPGALRDTLEQQQIKSLIAVPCFHEDILIGFTGFDSVKKFHVHSDKEIELLKFFSQILVNLRINAQAKKDLLESEYRLITHLQLTPVGAIAWDLNFKTTEWNPAAEKMFGYSKQEAIGKHPSELIIPEDMKELINTVFKNLLSEQGGTRSRNENITKDGKQILCDWYNTPLKNIDGEVIGVASLVHDITQRVKTFEALKEQKEFNEKIVQTSHTLIVGIDTNRKIKIFNRGAEIITGFKSQEVLGKDWFKIFVSPENREEIDEVWQVAWGAKFNSYINPILMKNGDEKVISWQTTGMYDGADETNHMLISIGEDITERKIIEAQLQQALKMESIGTLTGGIAHDFNNLLYMIVGNTELALEDVPEWNPGYNNLKEIKSASLKAAGIVKQLLNFTRKSDQKLNPINIIPIIKDVLKLLRSTIPTTIEIQEDLSGDDIVIFGDQNQINQVIMNLCINASHAMEDTGGIITVKARTITIEADSQRDLPEPGKGKYIEITVSDTGPGIDINIINRIFDPYFTTKEMGQGSGMGLSIVHGIVTSHDGAISVNSTLGKGSVFIILFPVIDEIPGVKADKRDEIPHGSETILFIDDEKVITDMMQQIFLKLGYKVETRLEPLEALDLFKSKPEYFDLVITDMTMPHMTGVALSKKLMDIRSDIPVIICTGHSSLIDEEKAKKLGIAGFVMKPVSMATIAKKIRKVLDK